MVLFYKTFTQTKINLFRLALTHFSKGATITPLKRNSKSFTPINKAQILSVKDLNKTFADNNEVLFKDVSFRCQKGSKVTIVGVNGSGKSTLLKILAGEEKEYKGSVEYTNEDFLFGYLSQNPKMDDKLTVYETIKLSMKTQYDLIDKYSEISKKYEEDDPDFDALLEEQEQITSKIDYFDCWNLDEKVDEVMKHLNCPHRDKLIENLSGGQKRRVNFVKILLCYPDVLFLDEPTNHLDMDSIKWLTDYLKGYKGTLFTISHDRFFIDNISEWIIEVDAGKIDCFPGNFSDWVKRKKVRVSINNRYTKDRLKKLTREVSNLKNARKKLTKVKKGRLEESGEMIKVLKGEKSTSETLDSILIPDSTPLASKVIDVNHLDVSYDGVSVLENVNVSFKPGTVVGVIGPNGSGKTTLFRAIMDEIGLDNGSVDIGKSVKIGYFSQMRENLNRNNKVWEEICGNNHYVNINDKKRLPGRNYVAQFMFKGRDQEKRIKEISGGEKNRVCLAKVLKRGCNVLLLDEPSNDLDIITLTALEEALKNFQGLVICISHDRYFLKNICTNILEFDGKCNARYFNGDYDYYLKTRNMK